jgi:hypothetical protein
MQTMFVGRQVSSESPPTGISIPEHLVRNRGLKTPALSSLRGTRVLVIAGVPRQSTGRASSADGFESYYPDTYEHRIRLKRGLRA